MNNDWKQDPRLQRMSRSKLEFLNTYAERFSNTPRNQMMAAFLSMQNEAKQRNIQFNAQETDLLIAILSSNMSPEERQRLETLTLLAKKLAARN